MEQFVIYAKSNLLPLVPLVFVLVILSKFILELLSRIGKKPKVQVYPAGKAEIGFSQYGPTIALFGTIRAQKADAFISEIEIKISSSARDMSRVMKWRAFKPYIFGLIPDNKIKLELVSAFLLTVSSPFKYNIVFADDPFIEKYSPLVPKVQALWEAYKKDVPEKSHSDFEEFLETEEMQNILAEFRSSFYWKTGKYNLEMLIHTSTPDKVYKTSFEFTLSSEQIEVLEGNPVKILRLICGTEANCKYVFSEYTKSR